MPGCTPDPPYRGTSSPNNTYLSRIGLKPASSNPATCDSCGVTGEVYGYVLSVRVDPSQEPAKRCLVLCRIQPKAVPPILTTHIDQGLDLSKPCSNPGCNSCGVYRWSIPVLVPVLAVRVDPSPEPATRHLVLRWIHYKAAPPVLVTVYINTALLAYQLGTTLLRSHAPR